MDPSLEPGTDIPRWHRGQARWPRSRPRRDADVSADDSIEPIVEHVAALIAGKMSPDELVSALISRQAKPEKV